MTSTSIVYYIPCDYSAHISYLIHYKKTGKSVVVQDTLRTMLEDKLPTHFICDVELLTLGRVFNTFKVINPYKDAFSEATIIPNFYDNELYIFS